MSPLIAVSTTISEGAPGNDQVRLDFAYLERIRQAGGEPVLVTPFSDPERIADLVDGWMITGGPDLPPTLYGQADVHPKCKLIKEERLDIETAMLTAFADSAKPILGICFGMQFLNVKSCGTLHQHLPDVVGHERHTKGESVVVLDPDSRLARAGVSLRFRAKCSHHQAIDRVASGWRIVATDEEDGQIEAIEEESDRWRVAVQWHPERTPDSEATHRIFEAFVRECATRR